MVGQMKIQQMAFMILALVFFFILVGLFFFGWQVKGIKSGFDQQQRDQAISSLKSLTDMAELNCDSDRSFCLDEDKLVVMSGESYDKVWPVSSVEVYKVYPEFSEEIKCPGLDCNYYSVYESGQENIETYATFVSICKWMKEFEIPYEKCEIGKLVVGVVKKDVK